MPLLLAATILPFSLALCPSYCRSALLLTPALTASFHPRIMAIPIRFVSYNSLPYVLASIFAKFRYYPSLIFLLVQQISLAHPPQATGPINKYFHYTYNSAYLDYVSGIPVGGLNVSGGDVLSVFGHNLGSLNTVRSEAQAFIVPFLNSCVSVLVYSPYFPSLINSYCFL
jgi:hypothetical protein